jgi:hypothetical protein
MNYRAADGEMCVIMRVNPNDPLRSYWATLVRTYAGETVMVDTRMLDGLMSQPHVLKQGQYMVLR